MRATRICLLFLTALLLMPGLAFGQTGTERNTENVEKSPGAPSHPGGAPDLSETKQAIVKLTNQFRAENQRGELKSNTKLAKAAQSFAEFLARTDQFSHTADGKEP